MARNWLEQGGKERRLVLQVSSSELWNVITKLYIYNIVIYNMYIYMI